MRAAGKEDTVRLIPCKNMTLEDTIAYVQGTLYLNVRLHAR